jgi:mannitol/fructose-specific phosphotransferase system IIA component (Ntr-type)
MGMLVDIRIFADMQVLKIGLLYALLAILAKVIGCALPALFMNFNWRGALRIGAGMVPRGEVALIIAGIGMTTICNGEPILNAQLFGVVIIMTLLTTLLAPPLLTVFLNLKGKGVRKEQKDFSVVHTPFSFNTPILADFVLRHLEENLRKENYMLSQLDKESGVMQIRKNDLSFALTVNQSDLIFESNPDEVPFIQAMMFEAIVGLHQDLDKLKQIANPSEMRQDYFAHGAEFAPENRRDHKAMINHCIHADSIILNLEAEDKVGVIEELVNKLDSKGVLLDKEACLNAVIARENVASTCMENGIALPHARTDAARQLTVAVGISKKGYNFDSLDGQASKIFILCLSPKSDNVPHIECLAAIGSVLAKQENIDKILAANTPEEVVVAFRQQ